MQIEPLFPPGAPGHQARMAIFMSGTGSNARALLEYERNRIEPKPFKTVLIFTDSPKSSMAIKLAEEYSIPCAELDIRQFYLERGESTISLNTPRRRLLRAEWTNSVRALIAPYQIDFIVLAGFVPLCNIVTDYPCLNVHPGDLTVEDNGVRIFAGLHFLPVEKAITMGFDSIRSSVILAQPFVSDGRGEMDSGPVLGISEPMPLNLMNRTIPELKKIASERGKPPFQDLLREVAATNLERLKLAGDHVVLTQATADFAWGKFGLDENRELCYRPDADHWIPVQTVEYSTTGAKPRPRRRNE